jgi:hypothetical protein
MTSGHAQRIVLIAGLVAIAVMLAVDCAHTPMTTSGPPGTGVIAGRVADEHGAPLQTGIVAVKDMGSDYVRVQGRSYVGSTGPDGKYSISNVPVGTFTVRGTVLGFDRQDRDSVHVGEHDTTIVNFVLKERAQRIDHVDAVH